MKQRSMNHNIEVLAEDDKQFLVSLLHKMGSTSKRESVEAAAEFAEYAQAALATPLKQGVLTGDIVGDIYEVTPFQPGARVTYPIDFYRNDNADEYVSYVVPQQGKIPSRQVQGDEVMVPTYEIAGAIDMLLRYARDARWDVVSRAMQVLETGFVKKNNDDGWHTILSAAVDRNLVAFDSDAANGQFTKRLISLMKVIMRRNAGGNSTSVNRGALTDLYISPEAMEDIRNWDVDQVDEVTRRQIYLADDDSETLNRIFGVNIHTLDELGENQIYQDYLTSTLSASLPGSDTEFVVGLDLNINDSFVRPLVADLEIHEDENLHRHRKTGFYGFMEGGWGVLNGSRVLLGSI